MTAKMLTKGDVEFNGQVIKLGKDYLVNGRKGRPFLAWVRDGKSNLPAGFVPQPNTTIRIKWDGTYMPSDFVSNFGRQPVIQELAPN